MLKRFLNLLTRGFSQRNYVHQFRKNVLQYQYIHCTIFTPWLGAYYIHGYCRQWPFYGANAYIQRVYAERF